jgi:hypothetical protein
VHDDLDTGVGGAHAVHMAGQKALMDGTVPLPEQDAAGGHGLRG